MSCRHRKRFWGRVWLNVLTNKATKKQKMCASSITRFFFCSFFGFSPLRHSQGQGHCFCASSTSFLLLITLPLLCIYDGVDAGKALAVYDLFVEYTILPPPTILPYANRTQSSNFLKIAIQI